MGKVPEISVQPALQFIYLLEVELIRPAGCQSDGLNNSRYRVTKRRDWSRVLKTCHVEHEIKPEPPPRPRSGN
ncbi:hypothetical protein GCD22_02290 [Acidithiobacillus thiooxidans ATCC 19377]|uniref:Uncharacterized protein n=1 Tax=Acidithiobacillus thiooxidans ATCC 19377 TaxID=637390 RepID=A0A5P9XR46_ACITH|nr:hypothetical protein GCD22_02290 [Acidithiobacillus thiooxidans ATCC 19377]